MGKFDAVSPSASLAAQLAAVIQTFCEHHKVGPAALSQKVLGDSRFFPEAIRAAEAEEPWPFHSRRYDTAMLRMAALWPKDIDWPEGVPRPARGELPLETGVLVAAWIAGKAKARNAEHGGGEG